MPRCQSLTFQLRGGWRVIRLCILHVFDETRPLRRPQPVHAAPQISSQGLSALTLGAWGTEYPTGTREVLIGCRDARGSCQVVRVPPCPRVPLPGLIVSPVSSILRISAVKDVVLHGGMDYVCQSCCRQEHRWPSLQARRFWACKLDPFPSWLGMCKLTQLSAAI